VTVILLDRNRPRLVPVEAATHLSGPVEVAEDVPAEVVDHLTVSPGAPVLVAFAPTEPGGPLHPKAAAWVADGATVIGPPDYPGAALLDAVALMGRLREHGHWESEQTHHSLRRYLLEEAYELLDAVHTGDRIELREELGDVLLQVLFHSRIAADHPEDPFTIDDVAATLTRKLRNRTPLDYGDPGAPADAEQQNQRWNERKAAEKRRKSALDGIAMAQPALALAEQVLARARDAGFPLELVPAEVCSVRITAGGEAEQELRRAVVAFATRFRAAEAQRANAPSSSWLACWNDSAVSGVPAEPNGESRTDTVR
jgi:XTP/dITP diphosphohydrolase